MDTAEVRTPRTAPISCPFESVVEGTAKKWRNNSYVPSIKCTSMCSPIRLSDNLSRHAMRAHAIVGAAVECASAESKKPLPAPHGPPGLLRAHMLVPALGAAFAVKERQNGLHH